MKLRVLVTVGLVGAALTVTASAALACSLAGQPPLRMGLEQGLFDFDGGIYEQETIARAPSILIRDAATASVVTRYWGTPPPNLGTQYKGGGWLSWMPNLLSADSCEGLLDDEGNILTPDGSIGTVGYGYAPPPQNATGPLSPEEAAAQGTVPWHRSAPSLLLDNEDIVGGLSVHEMDTLEATFGPATEVDHPISAYILATVVVWWPTVIGLAVVAGVIAFTVYRIRERRSRDYTGSSRSMSA